MAEDVFKNVQVLKGIPVDEFMGTMGFFSASLGLNCTDCHVDESGGNWAKYADDNALKRTARRMMQMVSALNRSSFGGRQVVTCNTCHRGTRRPNVMPSLALLYGTPPPDEPGEPFAQAPGQPAADQVLDKYLQALGGAQRLASAHQLRRQGLVPGVRRCGEAHAGDVRQGARRSARRSSVRPRASARPLSTAAPAGSPAPETERPVPLLAVDRTGTGRRQARSRSCCSRRGSSRRSRNWRVGAADRHRRSRSPAGPGHHGPGRNRHVVFRRGVGSARAAGALHRVAGRPRRHADRLRGLSRRVRNQDAVPLDGQPGWTGDRPSS